MVKEQCTLLNGVFDNLIQILLGIIALSVLILKRYVESPRRPLQIWAFDASKQAIGAGIAHLANLVIAIGLHEIEDPHLTHADECALYFVNFAIDTTVGLVMNWALLTILISFAYTFHWPFLQIPGDYGNPIQYKIWFIQLISWIFIILLNKIIIAVGIYCMEGPLGNIAEWLFHPLQSEPKIELIIVMIACPCIMNALQFWIQDTFLKKDSSGNRIPNDTIIKESIHHEVELSNMKNQDEKDLKTEIDMI